LGLFNLPGFDELADEVRYMDIDKFAAQHAVVVCPITGCLIKAVEREAMNAGGLWLPDGVMIDAYDRISGNPRTSDRAGFWLGGVAATYVKWVELIRSYLQAVLDFQMTGDEKKLQTTTNTDQSLPYTSRHLVEASRDEGTVKLETGLKRYIVPDWTRSVVAFVDPQGGRNARFEVRVHAVGKDKEQALIDAYAIKTSNRDGLGDEKAPLDPAAHPQDWDLITEKVVKATYRTNIEGREIRVRKVMVDSGGEAGVTDKAYAWFRRLRKEGLHRRVRLTKGNNSKVDWHTRESMVGGKQGEGDIPLLLFCPNKFKDMVAAGRKRRVPGPGYYHWPEPKGPKNPDGWLNSAVLAELDAEVRNEFGVWEQIKARNETLDGAVSVLVGCMDLGMDKKGFWDNPPSWALPLDQNSDVIDSEERRALKDEAPAVAATGRRVSRSSYLG